MKLKHGGTIKDIQIARMSSGRVWLARIFNVLYTIIAASILAGPLLYCYVAKIVIFPSHAFTISFYGVLIIFHYTLQSIFAVLNRIDVEKNRNIPADAPKITTALLAVGYREDPTLFQMCLESTHHISYEYHRGVIVVIDGDDEGDAYMGDLFLQAYPDGIVTNPGRTYVKRNQNYPNWVPPPRPPGFEVMQPMCLMAPHGGKRSAMEYGFKELFPLNVDAVVVTDSDTILDPDCITHLANELRFDEKVGAATGNVRILNPKESVISFLSSLRYWMAFNLERGCQSYFKCVTCVSGPLGIYRMDVIHQVIDKWRNQTFLGKECTYGDDRNLTNCTLGIGKRITYTHLAFCDTETPTNYFRWITQQTRWSKSFFREALINIGHLHLHSLWLAYELSFQLVYPFIIIAIVFLVLYVYTLSETLTWLTVIFFSGFYKAIIAMCISGEVRFLLFPQYGYYFLFGMMLAKIQALLFIYNNGWGTSSRNIVSFGSWSDRILPVAWILMIVVGVIRQFINFWTQEISSVKLVTLCSMIIFAQIYWWTGFYIYKAWGRRDEVYVQVPEPPKNAVVVKIPYEEYANSFYQEERAFEPQQPQVRFVSPEYSNMENVYMGNGMWSNPAAEAKGLYDKASVRASKLMENAGKRVSSAGKRMSKLMSNRKPAQIDDDDDCIPLKSVQTDLQHRNYIYPVTEVISPPDSVYSGETHDNNEIYNDYYKQPWLASGLDNRKSVYGLGVAYDDIVGKATPPRTKMKPDNRKSVYGIGAAYNDILGDE
ncbi:Hyaluronan synthase 3 [Terramyces sp. JEL0728]|nr:Hyaluronan synthase 3 [Terramyces sp. JEL0728]